MKYFRARLDENNNQRMSNLHVVKGMDYLTWYDLDNDLTYVKITKYDNGKIIAVGHLPGVDELTEEEFNQAIQNL